MSSSIPLVQSMKPMAISSITSAPPLPPSPVTPYSQDSRFYNYSSYTPYYRSLRSPPTTPGEESFSSPPSSPHSYASSESLSHHHHNDDTGSIVMVAPPLTLEERRQRNKAASAKYRQKKNQQQNDMRQMIGRISEQNAVLGRQLQELRLENERLRATADRLRGNMVAKKMLRQWIGRHKEPETIKPSSRTQLAPCSTYAPHYQPDYEYPVEEVDFDYEDELLGEPL